MFLKNKNIIFKIRRSKVTDYAALRQICAKFYNNCRLMFTNNKFEHATKRASDNQSNAHTQKCKGLALIKAVVCYARNLNPRQSCVRLWLIMNLNKRLNEVSFWLY